jgi:hypothetical protein
MTDADLLLALGIDPATLDPAPAAGRDGFARVGLDPAPCSLCGRPASVTKALALDGGHRWLDRCLACFTATARFDSNRTPSTTAGIVADLRAAAAEAGVALTVAVDGEAG